MKPRVVCVGSDGLCHVVGGDSTERFDLDDAIQRGYLIASITLIDKMALIILAPPSQDPEVSDTALRV
jgi:hypothetical protein